MNTVVNLSANPMLHTGLAPQTDRDESAAALDLNAEHVTPTGAPRVERSAGRRGALRSGDAQSSNADKASPAAPQDAAARTEPVSLLLPMLLGGTALLGSMVFQNYQHWGDRQTLQTAYTAQQQTVDNAGKLRASLDALAADTQRMADAGNASARLLVEELRKRGVTINAAGAGAGGGAGVAGAVAAGAVAPAPTPNAGAVSR